MADNSRQTIFIFLFILIFSFEIPAQNEKLFLGLSLRPEVHTIADEIEQKTKRKIYAEFVEFDDPYLLGASFINRDGIGIVRANTTLRLQKQKLEAVIAHELLHLRLRANNYPVFLFAPNVKTQRGLAQDVEQSNANDLTSLIEHRIFKGAMEKLGLIRILNLAGDTARSAERRSGEKDGQADAINFARAVLEYQNRADIEDLRKFSSKTNGKNPLKSARKLLI